MSGTGTTDVKRAGPSQKAPGGVMRFLRRNGMGYVLVAPLMLGLILFVLWPMIQVFIYSFQDTNGMSGRFVGLQNYKWVLSDDTFFQCLRNTIYMAVFAVVLDIIFCFVTASLINSLSVMKNFFKSLYFLPNVVSSVAVAMLFTFIFYPSDSGILNYFLGIFGVPPVGWLVTPNMARLSIVIMGIWRSVGYDTILFLAGLQSIPHEIYDAAMVDGANGLQKWWYITIPSMKPTFTFIIIMATMSVLRRFDDVWMIGGIGGNPGGSLQTMVLYIYRNAWSANEVGIASTASVILFFLTLALTLINYKLMGKDNT